MKISRPGLRWIVAGGLTLAVLAGGGFWWILQARRAVVTAAVPAPPDLSAWPAELRQRRDDCVARINAHAQPVAALGELSRLYHANGFIEPARQCYEGLVQLEGDNPRWSYRQAMILSGFGENEPAIALLQRAIADAPDYTPARLRLGEILLKRDELAAAAAVFNAVLARDAHEPYAQLGLARCDIEAGRWEAARARLEPLVTATKFALGYDLIVTVYERLGMPERAAAIRGQGKASGAYRDLPDPWMDELYNDCFDTYQLSVAAGVFQRRGDTPTALRHIERAVALAPQNASFRFQWAGFLLDARELTKARDQLERCIVLAPQFPDPWAHLASLLEIVGDTAGAERILAEGLSRCPDSPGLHLLRAKRHKKAGRIDAAIRDFQTSIRLRPTEADASIELAMTLLTLNRVEEAREELERALLAEPDHPMVLCTLALNAIQRGDETEARKYLARAEQQPRVRREDLESIQLRFRERFAR